MGRTPWPGAALAGLVAVVLVSGLVLQFGAAPEHAATLTVGDRVAPLTMFLFAIVGGVVTSRRPTLPVGWLLLGFAGLMAVSGATTGLAQRARAGALGDVAAWVQAWIWLPAIVLLAMALLHFPDGRLPSRRWRHLLRLQVTGLAVAGALAIALWPHRGPALLSVDDPWPGIAGSIGAVALPFVFVGFAGALVSLLLRWHTADRLVRLQLKWLLLAVALLVGALVLAAVADLVGYGDQWWQDLFGIAGLLLLPVAIGAAVLRYRLFEIDRIISRTLAWLIVSALLVAVYVAGVLGLGAVLPASGDLVVAASTLAAAALFHPVRERVQRRVDRRFDRAGYDAARTIDSFGRSLRDEVQRDAVVERLRHVAAATFGASSVGLVVLPPPGGGR